MATAKKRVFKVIKSTKGEFTFPTINVDGQPKSLTCYPNRWTLLPKEFVDNEYLDDALAKGMVELKESDSIPEARRPYTDVVENDPTAKGWLDILLNGPYTDQMKSYLVDWRSSRTVSKGRQGELKNRILPLVQCAIEREKEQQNRKDLLQDLERLEQYILKEEWNWDVQSAGRGNTRP